MHLAQGKIRIPALPLLGGCQCGAVRYRIVEAPVVFYLCHCLACQRHTSSAFGESLRIRAAALEMEGPARRVNWMADSGNRRSGEYCAECGVRLVHYSGSEHANVKAGTLDDPSWLIPAGHIWVRSRQPFIVFAPDDLAYSGEPEDGFEALVRRWRAMVSA